MAILFIAVFLSGQIIYVPGDYATIQGAINAAGQTGYDIVVSNGTYSAFNYGTKVIDIRAAYGHSPVVSSTSGYVVNMGTGNGSTLTGFEISGSSSVTGIYCSNNIYISISNCIIENIDTGIYLSDCQDVIITSCELSGNDYGIYVYDHHPYNSSVDLIQIKCFSNETAIYIDGIHLLYLNYCEIVDNDNGINISNNYYVYTYLNNSTFSENEYGIISGAYTSHEIYNSIIWNNDTNLSGTPSDLDIGYSCIEGGYTGAGNTDEDPLFCNEYPYYYYIMEGSPCIDTGAPGETDYDGTRLDMGCYPTLKDIKECSGNQWNYVSFPRLYRTGNASVDVVPLLENFLDWDFDLELVFLNETELEYFDATNDWVPDDYDVQSTEGFKLDPQDTGYHYLPTVYNASRLLPSQTIDLSDEGENWIGYWLPYTQNIKDAFGHFWEYIYSVEAEDWYYEWSKVETPTSSPTGKNMVYGKGYIVTVFHYIEDFYWPFLSMSLNSSYAESQYFTYDYLADYEAIDVMDIPEDVIEIGVYEDDNCVGAVVVQDNDEQILAYTTGQSPISFEVVTGNRQANQPINNYSVLNRETGNYENRPLISGQQKHSVIMFGNLEDPQSNTPSTDAVILYGNYPNPFNPETNISFSLPADQEIELSIYNLKGQLVRHLISGQFTSGENSVTWDGTDNEGKNVGSGLYLYKLKTSDQEFSKKMLLLK